jgi:hypothetical protein
MAHKVDREFNAKNEKTGVKLKLTITAPSDVGVGPMVAYAEAFEDYVAAPAQGKLQFPADHEIAFEKVTARVDKPVKGGKLDSVGFSIPRTGGDAFERICALDAAIQAGDTISLVVRHEPKKTAKSAAKDKPKDPAKAGKPTVH